jgi:oxygen-independent coproporphyrinogen-3 oxidase
MYGPMDDAPLFANIATRPEQPSAAYVHIPFCPSRCTFCHWVTKTKSRAEEVDIYLDYLEREMILYKSKLGVDAIPVRSVLIGGGTPTYLTPRQMERFLRAFTTHFDLSGCTQFSVEPEPTTILGDEGREKLRIMKSYGVNRLSMGVQSFDDRILGRMGRVHNRADIIAAIEQIKSVGFDSVMIDLIYGYPDQTIEQWIDSLRAALALDIDGWQLYRLRIKAHGDRPGNIIRIYDKRTETFPEAEAIRIMKYLGIEMSEQAGYHEHQTRCFTRTTAQMSHYLRDWCCNLTDVAGVGVSSWSNLRGVFALNVGDDSLERYYSLIAAGKVSVDRGKVRTREDEVRRSFILPLKNAKVDKAAFLQRTGVDAGAHFGPDLEWAKGHGLVEENSRFIELTRRGRFFADEVAMRFFQPMYLPRTEMAVSAGG